MLMLLYCLGDTRISPRMFEYILQAPLYQSCELGAFLGEQRCDIPLLEDSDESFQHVGLGFAWP